MVEPTPTTKELRTRTPDNISSGILINIYIFTNIKIQLNLFSELFYLKKKSTWKYELNSLFFVNPNVLILNSLQPDVGVLIFQTLNFVRSIKQCLKCEPSGCKDKGIIRLACLARNHILFFVTLNKSFLFIYLDSRFSESGLFLFTDGNSKATLFSHKAF